MKALRYIHAADLHLDAPFLGISRVLQAPTLAEQLREASFVALERLCELCELERADFLVIAGDIYNQENRSIKAQLALRDACERLRRSEIPVFLAHGNHDPLSSRFSAVHWPDNVVVFGPDVGTYPVQREGKILALIHGISHEKEGESRNLSRLFKRKSGDVTCFQLGVLHATLEGQAARNYAPCSLSDLRESGLDAWALGHIHKHSILSQQPFIAYSGSIQGLHVNEPGSHGCLAISARHDGVGWVCEYDFHSLAPVRWEEVECDLEDVESIDAVETRIAEALATVTARADLSCRTLVVRLVLIGRTDLDSLLRRRTVQEELIDRLQLLVNEQPALWIKDMHCRTRTPRKRNLERDDILGEVLRLAASLRDEPDRLRRMVEKILDSLYTNRHAAKFLSAPLESELPALLEEAEILCEDRLEQEK
jgi:DNA repair exonuclease SbcCD nuclease subunit